MLLNVESITESKLLFFDCVVISDLYLFQEIILLVRYFIFSKNLILLLIEKELEHKVEHYLFDILHYLLLSPLHL